MNPKIETKLKLEDHLSVTTAELVAIRYAIEKALVFKNSKIAICSDSLSAIQMIELSSKNSTRPDLILTIEDKMKQHTNNGNTVEIVWIPAHSGISGNEEADSLAKEARNNNINTVKVGLSTKECASYISQKFKSKRLQKMYEECNDSTVKEFKRHTRRACIKFDLSKSQNKLNRLRCNVAQYRLCHRTYGLYCRVCRRLITNEHVLIHCPLFDKERNEVIEGLRNERLDFTIENILSPLRKGFINRKIQGLVSAIDLTFPI